MTQRVGAEQGAEGEGSGRTAAQGLSGECREWWRTMAKAIMVVGVHSGGPACLLSNGLGTRGRRSQVRTPASAPRKSGRWERCNMDEWRAGRPL